MTGSRLRAQLLTAVASCSVLIVGFAIAGFAVLIATPFLAPYLLFTGTSPAEYVRGRSRRHPLLDVPGRHLRALRPAHRVGEAAAGSAAQGVQKPDDCGRPLAFSTCSLTLVSFALQA